jgi:uncharacterized protein
MHINSFFEGKSTGYKILIFILFVVLGFSLFNLFGVLFVHFFWENNEWPSSPIAIRLLLAFGTIGTFFVPAWLFYFFEMKSVSKLVNNPSLSSCFLPSHRHFKSTMIIIFISIVLIPIVGYLGDLNGKIELPVSLSKIEEWIKNSEIENNKIIELLTQNKNIGELFINLLFMALIPAISEEFFFRGAVQRIFSELFRNKHIVILVTAFIFSTIHFQFYGFIPRFVLGIYLGYLAVWSEKLFLPILAHFLHNSLSLCIDFFSNNTNNITSEIHFSDIKGFYFILPILIVLVFFAVRSLYMNLSKLNQFE